MKKMLGIALGVLFGIALSISVLSATGHINWKGTPQVENMRTNLDKIDLKIGELGEDVEYYEKYTNTLIETIKQYEVLVLERDNAIKELQTQVLERDTTISELIKDLDNEQAYNDVVDLDLRIKKLLDKLN